jgi:DNA replication and repair protein RecF
VGSSKRIWGVMMKVKTLSLINYRNYEDLKIDFINNINIFIGQNAQGKTNIVEAIYYAAMGKSHRSNNDQELIKWQKNNAMIKLDFTRLEIENNLNFQFKLAQNKEIIYNSHNIKPKDLIGLLNVVLFSPEDLSLIKGAPAGRRRFLDTEISQANPAYYKQLLQYNRIILQRNNLLKKIKERKAVKDLLDSWDEQLVILAEKITKKRIESVKKLNMLANLMHRKISTNKENLEISYDINGWDNDENLKLLDFYYKKISENRELDIVRGSTSIGPQRDDIILKVNNVNLRTFGSQGQQRTGVLALKLAELEFIKSETGEYPILLLDDVMSELDFNRREQLLSFIKDKIQTFITATDRNYFPGNITAKIFKVEQGKIMG